MRPRLIVVDGNEKETEMSEAALDIETLAETLELDVLEQLANTFEVELARTRTTLKQAAQAGDRSVVRREVHSLSAIFAQFGAPEISAELQEVSQNGSDAEVARLADELEHRAQPLLKALRAACR